MSIYELARKAKLVNISQNEWAGTLRASLYEELCRKLEAFAQLVIEERDKEARAQEPFGWVRNGYIRWDRPEDDAMEQYEPVYRHPMPAADTDNNIRQFVSNQQPLGAKFEKVLHDNLWELYDSDANPMPAAVVPDGIRKRADDIEYAVATGKMNADQVFTQMRQLLAAAPAQPANTVSLRSIISEMEQDPEMAEELRKVRALPAPDDVRRDAERYRWLRSRTDVRCCGFDLKPPDLPSNWRQGSLAQHLDAAIDAAIAEQEQEKQS